MARSAQDAARGTFSAKMSSGGKALYNADKTRTYRFAAPKPELGGRIQANLEEFKRVDGKLKVMRDGHIDIKQ